MVHKKTKHLKLKCPKCGHEGIYKGYPPDPHVSTVICEKCGYIGIGDAFKRVK